MSFEEANLVFYCDEDRRWAHPKINQWPDPTVWYDPSNDMVLESLRGNKPACMKEREDKIPMAGEAYRNKVKRGFGDPHASKKTITICKSLYVNRPYWGFSTLPGDTKQWPPVYLGDPLPKLADYYTLSVAIVQLVSLYTLLEVPGFPLKKKKCRAIPLANIR